jgi:predicted transposase YbfD/YdcC
MLAAEGAIVTIDAMGCQRDIAQKIIDKKADYVLALKGNQGLLREDVEVFVAEQKAASFQNTTISRDETVDGDHGRIETRTTTVIHDTAWLQDRQVARLESRRHGPEHPRNRWQDRAGDALLHHFAGFAGQPSGTDHPQPLGGREQPALGDGHDLSRRRVQSQNRARSRQFHNHQTHGS